MNNLSREYFEIMPMFNGKNSIKDIKRIIKEMGFSAHRVDENGRQIKIDINEGVNTYLENLIQRMTNSHMFEPI